jgi:hypothetical protein
VTAAHHDPGRDAAERYPQVTVARCALPGALAAAIPSRNLILISDQLDRAGWACSLAHELVHLDRGDRCANGGGVLDARLEHQVDQEAARRLIPLDRLASALMWGRDDWEFAHELGVDIATFRVRMAGLTADEQEHIDERSGARDWGAA